MHLPYRTRDRTTSRLQAAAWRAWLACPEIDSATRNTLALSGYTPAHIPHLPDEELLALRGIGPDRLADLRRRFPPV